MLRKEPKVDTFVKLFEDVGDKVKLEDIYEKTGIASYNSLKAFCSYIRKAKHIPEANRVDIRIKDGLCMRVK